MLTGRGVVAGVVLFLLLLRPADAVERSFSSRVLSNRSDAARD